MLESVSYPPPVDYPAADTSFSRPVRTRKLAILGFGETVRDAPVADPSWELVAMNGFWRAAEPDFQITAPEERYSLWLDMHTVEFTRAYGKAAGFDDKQERWLEKEHPFPIFMLDEDPVFPSVIRFPIEDVIAKVGRDYFTSSVAYALAWALANLETVAEVGLWGIDLTHSSEYADQRPCAEYWIGRLESAGIKVTIHENSALLKQRQRYGYEIANPLYSEIRAAVMEQAASLSKAIQEGQAKQSDIMSQMHTDDGALQACRGILERLNVWNRGGRI